MQRPRMLPSPGQTGSGCPRLLAGGFVVTQGMVGAIGRLFLGCLHLCFYFSLTVTGPSGLTRTVIWKAWESTSPRPADSEEGVALLPFVNARAGYCA